VLQAYYSAVPVEFVERGRTAVVLYMRAPTSSESAFLNKSINCLQHRILLYLFKMMSPYLLSSGNTPADRDFLTRWLVVERTRDVIVFPSSLVAADIQTFVYILIPPVILMGSC
jgi:hypothetical protein